VANIFWNSDGPHEQDDDGAFYVTQSDVETNNKFEEIMNGQSSDDE
jgi:hypothetical protein